MNKLGRVASLWTLLVVIITLPAVFGTFGQSKRNSEYVPDGYSETVDEILKDEKYRGILQNPEIIKTIEKRLGGARSSNSDRERGGSVRRRLDDADEVGRDRESYRDRDQCPEPNTVSGSIIKTKDSMKQGARFIESPTGLRDPEDCVRKCCEDKSCNTAVMKSATDGQLACYLFDCGRPSVCLFSSNPEFTVLQYPHRGSLIKQEHEDELEGLGTSPKTTPSPPVTEAPSAKSRQDGSLGRCTGEEPCRMSNSRCVAGECVCMNGYHPFKDHCKADCREYEFECKEIDQACIAIYDKCDGIEQCMDKTDEMDCQPRNNGGASKNISSSASSEESREKPSKQENSNEDSASKDKDAKVDQKTPPPSVVEAASSTVAPDNKPPADKRINDQSHASKAEPESAETSHWSMPANRGAVVALVLGMLVMVMLIIMVGCRVRNVRRRSRKGRPVPGGHDADYLINGMYL